MDKFKKNRFSLASDGKKYFENQAAGYSERSASTLWYRQRNRELAAVSAFLGPVAGEDVLDLGCGAGFYTRHCLDQGAREVIAVDFSPRMVAELPKGNVLAIVADATQLKLVKQVPKIVSAGLLEFVDDPKAVLANARRLVSPAGIMVCLVPPDNIAGRLYRMFHQRNGLNISLFSRSSFVRMAGDAGWLVDMDRFVCPFSMIYLLRPVEQV